MFPTFKGLFLDLDGVFAGFDEHFIALTGKHPMDVEKRFMWKVITGNATFFGDLPMIAGAERLWAVAAKHSPIFLTGAPPNHAFRQQKIEWVKRYFGDHVETIVLPKKEKQIYSRPGTVLIDDSDWVIDNWRSKGGHGILHVNSPAGIDNTIVQLEDYIATAQRA